MLARLFSLLFFVVLGWLMSRLFGRGRRASPARRPGRPDRLRSDGKMVRDRVCNTFLPRSRAIILREEGQERFFCSERCRTTYLEQSDSPARSGTGRA